MKNVPYLLLGNTCIFYISTEKISRLKRKISHFEKSIESGNGSSGLKRLYLGTADTIAKEVNSSKRLNTILAFLDFGINVSIRKEINFINSKSEHFNKEEYSAYVEGSSNFRSAIKTSDISIVEMPVKNYSSNRKIMAYAVPEIKSISSEIQKTILQNSENKLVLTDKLAEMIAIESKFKVPLLVDINQKWLEENYKKMKYKKAIYVINLSKHNKELSQEVIEHLKENKFIIGFKINVFNEGIQTLIKKLNPEFLIAGANLANNRGSSGLINLITIKRIAKMNSIRLIHENPPLNIEEGMVEKMGIKYYYSI